MHNVCIRAEDFRAEELREDEQEEEEEAGMPVHTVEGEGEEQGREVNLTAFILPSYVGCGS